MQWQPRVQRSQLFVVCFQHTETSQSFKWCLTRVENSLPWIFLNLNWELFVNDWHVYLCCLQVYDPASCPKPAGIGSLIKKEKSFLMIVNDSILAFFFLFFRDYCKMNPINNCFLCFPKCMWTLQSSMALWGSTCLGIEIYCCFLSIHIVAKWNMFLRPMCVPVSHNHT